MMSLLRKGGKSAKCLTDARVASTLLGRQDRIAAVSRHDTTRQFSDSSTSNAFNRNWKRLQRDNAARAHEVWKDGKDVVDYDYFRQEMAFRLVDRLDDILRDDGFPLALDIGTKFLHYL
jgi:hypothetical protein